MPEILSIDILEKITGPLNQRASVNAEQYLTALNKYGLDLGLGHKHRLAFHLGQLMAENGAFKWDRELWGPTEAQRRYDTRTDLGNTPAFDGDGFKYRGRTPIQITGKDNYRAFTEWARSVDPEAPDFVEFPDAVLSDPWEGLAPLWYWSERGLNALADAGDHRAVTRAINGGYNHLESRIRWTDRAQLVLLGYGPENVRDFQSQAALSVDGIFGPQTRNALHAALMSLPPVQSEPSSESSFVSSIWGVLRSFFNF